MSIVEVDIENGFWHGNIFWSRDSDGNVVMLTKKEYDQMLINGKVIEVE